MAASARVTTPFGATSTAAEVLDGADLTGRRAVVTGGASGIGVETARALAGCGAEVVLAVDNAGVMASPLMRTPEGWEMQFATNHLGHFALATGLHPALAAAEGARIVSVSSAAHRRSPVVFDDIHFEQRDYEPWLAYGQSKTANVLFAVEATRRWAGDGILANALHPGGIRTNLQRYIDEEDLDRMRGTNGQAIVWKTVEQGAATSALLAGSPLVDGVGGRYFEDCNQAIPFVPGALTGVAGYALDPAAAERLWTVSTETLAG